MMALDEAAVRAALRRVWPDPSTVAAVRLRALSGGLNPRSFLAEAGERRYVLRVPTPGVVALLDAAAEARAMRAAAAAGLAPTVIGSDAIGGVLLTEYRMPAWTPEMARERVNIPRIAALLRSLHGVAVELPAFRAERVAAEYLATLGGGGTLVSAERVWGDELLRLAQRFDTSYAPTTFCHNDLVAPNVLDDGATLLLVDFEYAVRSAPLLDLASLAAMNDYTDIHRSELLHAYYGGSVVTAMVNELDDAVRLVRLLAFFWARVGERLGGRKDVYAQLAAHLAETLK